MKKLLAYKRLFRIEHALLLAAAVLFAEVLVCRALGIPMPAIDIVLLSLAVPVFIEMGSFALNDWFDVETDRENKREDRPIAAGEIKKEHALYASAIAYAIGIAAAIPLPPSALHIAILFAGLSVFYSWFLKDIALVGNIYIASSMAIPFVFGNFIAYQQPYLPLFAIALVAFVAGLGREIIKSVEDLEGDVKHRKSKTLPVIVGKKNAIFCASACYFALVPLSFLPYYFGLQMNLISLGLVISTALAFAGMGIEVGRRPAQQMLEAARKASLLALAVGLAGYAASLI
ncbi:MAG: UbiA family prenyltransferase [Candidatus Micrarchaeota archaeon]|nr:UbiA family prenyltransferase [Candidatus Micrarchaeota archaeon]